MDNAEFGPMEIRISANGGFHGRVRFEGDNRKATLLRFLFGDDIKRIICDLEACNIGHTERLWNMKANMKAGRWTNAVL